MLIKTSLYAIVEDIVKLILAAVSMEVRTRSSSNHRTGGWLDSDADYTPALEKEKTDGISVRYNSGIGPTIRQRIRREVWEMGRVMTNLLQGRGSKVTYLLIPVMISLFWVLICLFTTRQPSISLEERLSQQHYRVKSTIFAIITVPRLSLIHI